MDEKEKDQNPDSLQQEGEDSVNLENVELSQEELDNASGGFTYFTSYAYSYNYYGSVLGLGFAGPKPPPPPGGSAG